MIKVHETISGFDPWDLQHDDHYFREENVFSHCWQNAMVITDLTNATQPGKTCREYLICLADDRRGENFPIEFSNYLQNVKLDIFEVVELLVDCSVTGHVPHFEGFEIIIREIKSSRTYSPFVAIKPIKPPAKWTLTHVWKALMSGQIVSGKTDQYLTDDYAWDDAVNYRKDEGVALNEMARNLIEHPSGWRVYVDKEGEEIIQLSVNCYHFDMKTFFFSKKAKLPTVEKTIKRASYSFASYEHLIKRAIGK